MFEEESEDYRKYLKSKFKFFLSEPQFDLACQGFKDGYNKAKEEMQEQGLALQSDMDKTIEQNIQLKKQIEKMKCCQNCRKFNNLSYDCTCTEVCNEWELRR